MGADDDKAQQEERVLQWLKKRGYTEVAQRYEEEEKQQPGAAKAGEGGRGAAGAGGGRGAGEADVLLFRSVQLVRSVWSRDCCADVL